jgi:hypothetical protein
MYAPEYYFLMRQILAAYDSSDVPVDLRPEENAALVALTKCLDDSSCDLSDFVSKSVSTLLQIKGRPSPRFRREVVGYVLGTSPDSGQSRLGHTMNQTVMRMWDRALRKAYRVQ